MSKELNANRLELNASGRTQARTVHNAYGTYIIKDGSAYTVNAGDGDLVFQTPDNIVHNASYIKHNGDVVFNGQVQNSSGSNYAVIDDQIGSNFTTYSSDKINELINDNLPSCLGEWDASTNTPTLTDNPPSNPSGPLKVGSYYIVSVAGSTPLSGITDWGVKDLVLVANCEGTFKFIKIDNSESSVIDDNSPSLVTTYSSQKVVDDFRKKGADIQLDRDFTLQGQVIRYTTQNGSAQYSIGASAGPDGQQEFEIFDGANAHSILKYEQVNENLSLGGPDGESLKVLGSNGSVFLNRDNQTQSQYLTWSTGGIGQQDISLLRSQDGGSNSKIAFIDEIESEAFFSYSQDSQDTKLGIFESMKIGPTGKITLSDPTLDNANPESKKLLHRDVISGEIKTIDSSQLVGGPQVVERTDQPPTLTDDSNAGFSVGDVIVNFSTLSGQRSTYFCRDNAATAAQWSNIGTGLNDLSQSDDILWSSNKIASYVSNNIPSIPQNNLFALSPPTVNDDSDAGYSIGSKWIVNLSSDNGGGVWNLVDDAIGSAIWVKSAEINDQVQNQLNAWSGDRILFEINKQIEQQSSRKLANSVSSILVTNTTAKTSLVGTLGVGQSMNIIAPVKEGDTYHISLTGSGLNTNGNQNLTITYELANVVLTIPLTININSAESWDLEIELVFRENAPQVSPFLTECTASAKLMYNDPAGTIRGIVNTSPSQTLTNGTVPYTNGVFAQWAVADPLNRIQCDSVVLRYN